MKTKWIVAAVVVGMLLTLAMTVLAGRWFPPGSRATVPYLIPYQGMLEKNGQLVNAIGSDRVSFRVSLWDAPTDGVRVWPEADQISEYEEHSVNVYSGRFAFHIGSEVPYRHVADTDLYLDIQLMGSADPGFVPLGGRQRFVSSPFAVAAERADTDFYVPGRLGVGTDAPDREVDIQGAARVSGELTAAGPVTIDGDMQTNGLLNVLGELQVDGQKPFMWSRYYHPANAVSYDTGMSSDDWWAVIAGFSADWGDIYEDGNRTIVVRCRMVESLSNTWVIEKDFASHNNHEVWTVDVLFIRKRLVDIQ